MRGWRLLALVVGGLGVALSHGAPAGGGSAESLPRYVCTRTTEPIEVDGSLSEPAWSRASVFKEFRTADGRAKGRFATEFRALWDDQYLYLAFKCADPDLIAKHTKRDAFVYEDDCAEAFISSGTDGSRYFEFEINPCNTVMDASVFPNEKGGGEVVDYGWNCRGLKTATEVRGTLNSHRDRDTGWVLEMALPFSQIGRGRSSPRPGETWRANLYRVENTGQAEFLCWSPTMTDPPSFHVPDRFGYLCFEAQSQREEARP